jgi:hypothetical protein
MKIINAVWEKRNINLETLEIEVDQSDTWEDLKSAIENLHYEYLVVKIPPTRTDLMFRVNILGLVFVELTTKAHFSGTQPELGSLQKRVLNALEWGEITPENKEKLFAEISLGLFKTDRVATDPSLGLAKSSARYLGWIDDELNSGAVVYEVTKNKELIGFFLMRKIDSRSSDAILAGLLEKYQNSGLGFVLNYLEIEQSKKIGSTFLHSTFSSNNRGATAVHMSMGYIVDHQHYVYVKHATS